MNRKGLILPMLVAIPLVLVAVVVGIIFAQANSRPAGPNPSVDRFLAQVACEIAVERELKAPATARYIHNVEGSDPWIVTGTVDSENSFGAMIRSSYTCTVDREDGKMVATLDELG